ncbi:MAG TPA: ABC transporter substrate-binding protein, partial [Rhodobacter sp.]|nr:ABC transporter substrate-binding protein [Rhodobacter sp.]
KMQISNDDVSAMAAWGDENSATNEEVANHFLKNYDAVWSSWVPADVADKVRAGL